MQTTRLQKKENRTNGKSNKKADNFFSPLVIQKKLSIGSPNDAYEMEADRVADKVVNMSNNHVETKPQTGALLQRKCASCEKEELQKKPLAKSITPLIQRASNGSESSVASNNVTSQINSSKGSGNMMDNNTQNSMENSFGADFSGVRIHTGSNAVQLSKQLNAQAFTVGNDVYFNEGKYNPSSNSGKHLLAHELTHTLQQGDNVQRKMIQRVLARQTTCTNNPLNLPSGGTIADPLSDLTAAVNKAVEFLDTSIDAFDYTRNQIIGGAPIAWPTIGDSLARAISIVGYDPNSRVFWTSTRGLNRASLLLRRLRAFRASLAGNGMFYVCLGPNTGTIGICSGSICGSAWAATCEGSFIIHLCEGFWNQNLTVRAETLIHESSHNFAAFINHNLRKGHAACYARFTLTASGENDASQRTDLCPNP